MHLSETLRHYLGWCPDRSMIPAGNGAPWSKTGSNRQFPGDAWVNDEVIVDYGSTGITLRFFLGALIGVIGIMVVFSVLISFATVRVISALLMGGLVLPIAIAILYRDLKTATLEITNNTLVIRRVLHRTVVIPKDEIALVEVRENVPPIPVRLHMILMVVVILASSVVILSGEFPQIASGGISSSSFFQYLGFYPSIVLFFLAGYSRSHIRSRFPEFLAVTTTTGKLAGIYRENPEEIAELLRRAV